MPNLVDATAIVVGWRQQVRALEAERKLSDLSDVRTVLDDAALALHNAAYPLDDARSNLTQYGRGFFSDQERQQPALPVEGLGLRVGGDGSLRSDNAPQWLASERWPSKAAPQTTQLRIIAPHTVGADGEAVPS